jgi:FAD/FMN-containing dehydrogenase
MTSHAKPTGLSPELLDRLRAIVGPSHALIDPDQQLPYLRELRDMYEGRSAVVLRPGSTDEVSKILALAHEHRIPMVPQAGNTGLVGGQVPMHGELLLSVSRLKAVRAVDAAGYTMTVETGLTLAEVQAVAEKANRLFPLSLPSEGSCQLGGNLGTNAGGVGVLAYGNTRQLVLGLEVVLADGRIWNGLKALKKDNTGYDLRDLFIGSEGTLGIITAAVLKLFPRPAEKATAIVAMPDFKSALGLFSLAQDTAGTREPFPTKHAWYVLLEISGLKADGTAEQQMLSALEAATEKGLIVDAAIAGSIAQARDFWRLREAVSEAQRPEGASIKHDVSVPVQRIPEFVERANALVEKLCPGVRPLAFGHFGDGNVHYNITQPVGMPREDFMRRWDDIMGAVHALVVEMGGSISAEHGIGFMKRGELAHFKSDIELELMRKIKAAFDPRGILNPGKVL